jgi:hypothetical protein
MENKKIMDDFLESCLQLGKELLDKDNLTKTEEMFLQKLDLAIGNITI